MAYKSNRVFFVTVWLVSLIALPVTAIAQAEPMRHITISAQGYIEAVPDILTLRVSVKKTRNSLDEARQEVDAQVEKLTRLAKKHGVKANDIDSSSINAWPEYEWRKQERHYRGESVQRDVVLTVRNLDHYGKLMEGLGKFDLENMQPPRTSHSQLDTLKLDALKVALANGKRKAQLIAEQVDGKLGSVISVEEVAAGAPPVAMRRMEMAAMADADGGGVAHGFSLAKQKINASVVVRYNLD